MNLPMRCELEVKPFDWQLRAAAYVLGIARGELDFYKTLEFIHLTIPAGYHLYVLEHIEYRLGYDRRREAHDYFVAMGALDPITIPRSGGQ